LENCTCHNCICTWLKRWGCPRPNVNERATQTQTK
jgi:hypothetical protein